jgi:protein tyrosine phosphatase (PTP) superfamily phosphohydrolase (DUF442 family)
MVLALLLLAAALRWAYWDMVQFKLATVSEGQVYRSAAMPLPALVDVVTEHRIRSVVDLRVDHEVPEGQREGERQALARLGVSYLPLPSGQVPQETTVARFLEHAEQSRNRPMLIHCRDGEGRSVLFSAIYRIELEGWSNDRARRATRFFPSLSSFSLDRPKGRFLDGYRPRVDDD